MLTEFLALTKSTLAAVSEIPKILRWLRTHRSRVRPSQVADPSIRHDGVIWIAEAVPNTTNSWTLSGPFCAIDRVELVAVEMTGWRRPPDDSDSIHGNIEHLLCAACSTTFDLGGPTAGALRSVGAARREAISRIRKRDPKGPADLWYLPQDLEPRRNVIQVPGFPRRPRPITRARVTADVKAFRCTRCLKEHPPEVVRLSEGNRVKQPRPFHCRCCPETQPIGMRPDNWQDMTVAEAQRCRRHGRHDPAPGGCCLRPISN